MRTHLKRIEFLNKVPVITCVLFAASCSTETSLTAPGDPAFSTHGSGGPPIETTFSATLVGFEPESPTVLPSGTVLNEFTNSFESEGDWEGTFRGDFRSPNGQTIHKNGVITGRANFTFEGTVLGREGTVESRFLGHTKADGTFIGRFTILSGTGELANLRGHGTNVVVGPGEIEGTVLVHFAP